MNVTIAGIAIDNPWRWGITAKQTIKQIMSPFCAMRLSSRRQHRSWFFQLPSLWCITREWCYELLYIECGTLQTNVYKNRWASSNSKLLYENKNPHPVSKIAKFMATWRKHDRQWWLSLQQKQHQQFGRFAALPKLFHKLLRPSYYCHLFTTMVISCHRNHWFCLRIRTTKSYQIMNKEL